MSQSVPAFVFAARPGPLPPEYAAVPLTPGQRDASVKLCVVVRRARKSGEPASLVTMRRGVDARVHLGCLADAGGRVMSFVEVWAQDLRGLGVALGVFREGLDNPEMDQRWRRRAAEAARLSVGGVVETGWEDRHPGPMFLDVRTLEPLRAGGAGDSGWALCEDDGLLARKGLPPFTGTLVRHLHVPALGDKSEFVRIVGENVPDDDGAIAAAVGLPRDALAVNPTGGLMAVLPLAPLSYEQYIDALAGVGTPGTMADDLRRLADRAAGGGEATRDGDGRLTLASAGGWLGVRAGDRSARLGEVLHLKLRALASAVGLVREASAAGPMLNVRAESFRVRLAERGGAGLPTWWTGEVVLATPGEARELPIPDQHGRYFAAASQQLSVYTAGATVSSRQGRGSLRIRKVLESSDGPAGPASLEATLSCDTKLVAGVGDLIWLRLTVSGAGLDLVASAIDPPAGGATQLLLRTSPRVFPPGVMEKLRQAAGVPLADVVFELTPMLSTPCDLFSLGVLGVRTLVTAEAAGLPEAFDEMMGLAAAVAADPAPADARADVLEATCAAVGRVLGATPRLAQSLGSHRLVAGVDVADARAIIPQALWDRALAVVLRMFPGQGWFSVCRDFGDAPADAPGRVLDSTVDSLHGLLMRTRSLLTLDPARNREVRAVVRELLMRV